MRLIDADRLMERLQGVLAMVENEQNQTYANAIRAMIREVKLSPIIESEPVRHGRWIEVDRITWRGADDRPIDITVEEKCSNCGRYVERYETVQQENYCPTCGVKMDLKEE